MKMKNFELQRVENLGNTIDSIGVDHSNRGQLYLTFDVKIRLHLLAVILKVKSDIFSIPMK